VIKTFYPDPADKTGKLGMVDIKPVTLAKMRIGLPAMRANPELSGLSLLKQSRLSVCPVTESEWSTLCKMAGIPA
jgi:predicted RNA-binding protein with PUA-like domain